MVTGAVVALSASTASPAAASWRRMPPDAGDGQVVHGAGRSRCPHDVPIGSGDDLLVWFAHDSTRLRAQAARSGPPNARRPGRLTAQAESGQLRTYPCRSCDLF